MAEAKILTDLKKGLKDEIQLNHDIRYEGLYKISKILSKMKMFNKDYKTIVGCAKDMEDAIFKKTLGIISNIESDKFIDCYSDELRHILVNFASTSHVGNKDLEGLLKVNSLADICKMSFGDLYPSLWKPVFDDMRKQEESKERSANDTGIKCRRCGSQDLLISQSQTRSADEGSTIMITCNNCGNVKKTGG